MHEDIRCPSDYEMEEWVEEKEVTMTFHEWLETGVVFWPDYV